ncbi:MAG: hypothetical protein DHS20C11_05920 [Lysobacteraceae bacterium]|nr:MAG: hypothetical protein DHS20C11_05920 [Xanthomonadaceae bacterium]
MPRFSFARSQDIRWVLLLLLVFAPSTFAQVGDTALKIVVVDLDRVVANSSLGQQLQSRLEQFQQQIKSEVEQIQNQARDIRQRAADGVNTLSEEKLQLLQQEYEDKMIALQRFQNDKQIEGQKMQQEGLRQIEQQLEPVFSSIRDDYQLDLILNKVPGVVVMAGERADITQLVIDRLNQAP